MDYKVLLYNGFFGTYPGLGRFPSVPEIEFIADRRQLRSADAVVLHLPEARKMRDAVKYPGQLWVGWSMESLANTPVRAETAAMAAFDLHMGFERSSDVWCTYVRPAEEWRRALALPAIEARESAPAVLFQSANSDQCGRDPYLSELMQHLPFDSYGRFLNNRKLSGPDHGTDSKLEVLRRYRFTLAFENSMEPDYVTEKFFQPLMMGSVPVYRGAPNVVDFAPDAGSFIDASQMTPRELAEHLRMVADDEAACARLLAWRAAPMRPGFAALIEQRGVSPLERLAFLLRDRLADRGERPAARRPIRPFGWRGAAETHLFRARSVASRIRRRLRAPATST